MGKNLGEGAFAVVKEASHKKNGGDFAIKIVTKAKLGEEDAAALKEEIAILQELRHTNIIRLYEVFDEPKFHYLVMEVVRGGELFDRVVAKSYYNEKEARDVCKILLGALEYCHDQKVAHRDLKPENLLLVSKDDDADLKLADFGFAHRVTSETCLTTQCGTPGYVAPEVLEGIAYGVKSDMWSIGVITYILLGGYPPFIESNQRELFRKIRKAQFEFHPEYWGQVSQDAKDLISALLTADPSKRLSAKEALQNGWITERDEALAGKDLGKNLEEFKKFNAGRKFKAAVSAVVVSNKFKKLTLGGATKDLARQLTEEEVAEMKETFAMFDTDGGGSISMDELRQVMKKIGQNLSEKQLQELFIIADINGDGEIDFEEFKVMMQNAVGDSDRRKDLLEAFQVFDVNGDGQTSKQELKDLMGKFGQHLSDEELTAVMSEVDTDGSGEIDFEEFCQIMK